MEESPIPPPKAHAAPAAAACAGLLVIFALLSWVAVSRQSPTVDEPLHAVGAYLHVFDRDYRVDPEDPPLWNYLAMLPHRAGELKPDPRFDMTKADMPPLAYRLTVTTRLFDTPGNDGASFINSSRRMMLLIGIALGAMLSLWSWQLGGAMAAVGGTILFTFDPNFLAHAPLVKNDVAMAAVMFGSAWAAWSVGKSIRWWNVLILALLCGAAPTIKYSGLIVGPMLLLLLVIRARLPVDWELFGKKLRTRGSRFAAALGICLICVAATFFMIWASYGFRSAASPVANVRFDLESEVAQFTVARFMAENERPPLPIEMDLASPPLLGRLALFADECDILPHPWLYGLVFTYHWAELRDSYLLGQISSTGWWYYFPLTILFKTPLTTLVAAAIAIVFVFIPKPRDRWTILCLTIPPVLYGLSAMTSNLNLGIRHILPVFPFIFVAIAQTLPRLRPRPIAIVLGLILASETLFAYPHFLSFFNVASRSHRLHLLGDSNFDWGQDLTYLVAWQQRNPHIKLYLAYWGTADPRFYGIRRSTTLPGGFDLENKAQWPPTEPGVIAISATLLQGLNCPAEYRPIYAALRNLPPREIVGDTIYLFDWPLR